jgi:hypothetical protein
MADGNIIAEGEAEDEVWRILLGDKASGVGRYFGVDGARKLFLHHYPNGFGSVAYDEKGERGYKVKAKGKLDAAAPLSEALTAKGLGEAVLAAYSGTDLLYPNEKMKVREVLRGPQSDAFVQAAARFTLGDDRKAALRSMERAARDHEAAKWTIVSYLPFLWRPEDHMFLKPEATIDFAERTGHSFATVYAPALDMRVYDSLLDLASTTKRSIADMGPRDNIDVQSFIWVVSGAYEGEPPRP